MATTWSTCVGRRRRLPGDADGPAAGRGRAGDGDVAAQAHERARTDAPRDAGGGPVGRQRLGGRAEVEADAARDADGAVARVELHVLVARDRPEGAGEAAGGPAPRRGRRRSRARRWRCRPSGRPRRRCARPRRSATRERLEEQGADRHGAAGVGVHHLQLGVGAEPAAGEVDGRRARRPAGARRASACGGVLHDDGRRRADGAERAGGQDRLEPGGDRRHRDVPPDVTAGDDGAGRRGRRATRTTCPCCRWCRCCPTCRVPTVPTDDRASCRTTWTRSDVAEVSTSCRSPRRAGAGVLVRHDDPDRHGGAGGGNDRPSGQGAQPGLRPCLCSAGVFGSARGCHVAEAPSLGRRLIPPPADRPRRRTRCGPAVTSARAPAADPAHPATIARATPARTTGKGRRWPRSTPCEARSTERHLGRTLMHEHIFVLSPEIEKTAEEWDEAAEQARAVTKLRELKEHGIDTLVDLTVIGLGRYIPRVAAIADAGARDQRRRRRPASTPTTRCRCSSTSRARGPSWADPSRWWTCSSARSARASARPACGPAS